VGTRVQFRVASGQPCRRGDTWRARPPAGSARIPREYAILRSIGSRQGFRTFRGESGRTSARPRRLEHPIVATVLLNGTAFAPVRPVPSWGPLLDAVDRHVAPTGEIVATVRFDGVDEPGFRDDAVLGLILGSELIVEIETLHPNALLGEVLDEASRSLLPVAASARELAGLLRGAEVDAAARGIGQLAETIRNLVQLVVAAATARGVALDTLETRDGPAMPLLRALDAPLLPLLEAQRAGDWITVADILEYDVAPLMPRFDAVLDSLR
jgi:hypothetical protein